MKYLITGGPGFGKSKLIELLEKRGIYCAKEIVREISKTSNLLKFNQSIFKERIKQYRDAPKKELCFFDRGIPDTIAYLLYHKINVPFEFYEYVDKYKYADKIFIAPPWKEIYIKDKERKETFSEAIEIHNIMEGVYINLGYKLVQIPKKPIDERVNFILQNCKLWLSSQ